jgi:hypothetical protein
MSKAISVFAILLVLLLVSGCSSDGKLRTRGKILKGGIPYVAEETDIVHVTFVPIPEGGARPMDYHIAAFNKADGTFVASGKDGKGVPPGKYRIAIEHLRQRKDLLNGAFGTENSPFVREVKSGSDVLTLDISKPG